MRCRSTANAMAWRSFTSLRAGCSTLAADVVLVLGALVGLLDVEVAVLSSEREVADGAAR